MAVDPSLFDRLEAMGEEAVWRDNLLGLSGTTGSEHNRAVQEWLKSKAGERAEAREARILAISESSLSIAKEANRLASEDLAIARSSAAAAQSSAASAREQALWARWAAIIAVIAAAIAAKDQILTLIFGAP
jgi:hypothetical protein